MTATAGPWPCVAKWEICQCASVAEMYLESMCSLVSSISLTSPVDCASTSSSALSDPLYTYLKRYLTT